MHTLRVFFDTSVLISGSFSRSGASFVLLQLAGLSLIEGRISALVREDAQRNVQSKVPAALPALRVLLDEALAEGPIVTLEALDRVRAYAHAKDVPILASAVAQECRYLVTLNERDFHPPAALIRVARPGEMLGAMRSLLASFEIAAKD